MGAQCAKGSELKEPEQGIDHDDGQPVIDVYKDTEEDNHDEILANMKQWDWESNKPDSAYATEMENGSELPYQIPPRLENMLKKIRPLDPNLVTSIPMSRLPQQSTSYLIPSLNAIYVGSWAQGKPHGIGRLYYLHTISLVNNTTNKIWMIYEGGIYQGIPHGRGRQFTENGEFYEGRFKMAVKHGQGQLRTSTGIVYVGGFKNDVPDGPGQEIWPNRTEYKGTYKNGRKNGKGRISWTWREKLSKKERQEKAAEARKQQREDLEDGKEEQATTKDTGAIIQTEWYEGQFVDDEQEGFGTYRWADGRTYEGEWKSGQLNGRGKFTWTDGSCYEGDYCNDIRQGEGKLTFPSGAVFNGHWVMGKQHGVGTMTYKGLEYEGEWNQGIRIRWLTDPRTNDMSKLQGPEGPQKTKVPAVQPWIIREDRDSIFCPADISHSKLLQREHQALVHGTLAATLQPRTQPVPPRFNPPVPATAAGGALKPGAKPKDPGSPQLSAIDQSAIRSAHSSKQFEQESFLSVFGHDAKGKPVKA